jgi:hypothetical protein
MIIAQRIKGTLGITGLSSLESSYLQSGLAPRCRLITSWSWTWFQGFSCSLMKVIRELGSERCETVRSLSAVNKKEWKYFFLSTKGLERVILWYTNCILCALLGSYDYINNCWFVYKQEVIIVCSLWKS